MTSKERIDEHMKEKRVRWDPIIVKFEESRLRK